MQKRHGAVITGVLREVVTEGMIRELIVKRPPKHFQNNDGRWFRKHYPDAWASVQPQEIDFIEMYFVLFDGTFAKWFFSKLFERPEFLHSQSDWGPDLMWCGAAHDWSTNRSSCVFVPVVSIHYDTKTLSVANAKSTKKITDAVWREPTKTWAKSQPYKKWMEYSSEFVKNRLKMRDYKKTKN